MKVLVTGASGFVGREILSQLHEAGHAIHFIARRPDAPTVRQLASRFQAEVYPGDVLQAATLTGGFQGVEAVIHLVGIISEVGQSTYENVHIHGTENVVAAAQDASVKRFVHMSALGTRASARARYHQTKWAAEQSVRLSGLPFTIFRPSIIYGPDDLFVNLFARMSRFSPVLPVMGSGQSKLQPISVADVAACFVKALTEPQATNATFDLCGLECFTFLEILDVILAATGRTRLKLRVPLPLAHALAALLEFIFPRLLRQAPPLNRDQLLMLEEDNVGYPQPAIELFGLRPVQFREGIARYLQP